MAATPERQTDFGILYIAGRIRSVASASCTHQSVRPRDSAGRSVAQPALDRGEQSAAGGGERHFGADGARMLRLDCLAQFDRAEKIAFVRGYLARG
ncbi:hypothetical protein [Parasphingorhabdus sp.]|uniref:hypothetical protein n=1 Tax=Parasphingorhabdus sp. TaxID=2709688 RepID=UPI00326474C9